MSHIRNGINLTHAIRIANHLGLLITPVVGTGELRVRAPRGGASVKLNSRRKDAPRALVALLRQVQKQTAA